MADYKEFARQIKEKYPQYKDVDDMKLAKAMLEKYPQYEKQVTFEEPKQEKRGIDLTPSGLYKSYRAFLEAPSTQMREKALNNKDISFGEAYRQNREYQDNAPLNKVLSPALDIGTALTLPQINAFKGASLLPRLGNYALTGAEQGAVIGGLEGLKDEGVQGLPSGIGSGAAIGGLLGGGLPAIGNAALQGAKLLPSTGGLIARTIGRIQPETLKQAVKPNSKALDLSRDEAQNLLMNTTERIQKDYKNLMDNAGLDVQRAALNLPKERGVFASSLKNSLDDIYNGYSTSGIKELNPAYNNAGDIYDDISKLIEAGTDETGVRVSAENLNDIMGNLKNYPIDWSKTSAKDRQTILKQVYGDFQRRLGNLSPELRKANWKYSKLAKFDDNEGLRQIINPDVLSKNKIDSASSALRNYNSTVTKGNTNRNIQDLENILVANGKEPFLNDVDDVNAAMDLLNQRTTGDSWLANMATQATRPILKVAREFNRRGLPAVFANLGARLPQKVVPVLYGGVSNIEDY